MPSFQDYIDTLNSGTYKQKIKLQLLRSEDESIREEIISIIENSSGSVNIQRTNGIRRTCDITLFNLDGKYVPNINNFWIRQKFQLWIGLEMTDGSDYYFPQGLYVVDDPSVTSNFSDSKIIIHGVDKYGLLSQIGGQLEATYIIPLGTNIITSINNTIALMNDPKQPIIDTSLVSLTTPYTMTYETGQNIGDILIDLSQLFSCSIYYDALGQLTVERDIEDDIKPSQWDFSDNNQFVYQGSVNKYKWSEMYNAVKVTSSNINGQTYYYTAKDMNLASPTSIPTVGFERIFPYSSDKLSTLQQVTDLANYILKRKIALQNEIQINSIPMYHLDCDSILTLTDNHMKLSKERLLINSLSIPLNTGGQMTINCVKSKEIPFI